MPVKFYEFGQLVGGSDSGGGSAAPVDALYGPGQTFEGVLPIGNTTITFANTTKSVQVINGDDTDSFDLSIDGGLTWVHLGPYGQFKENISVGSIILRSTTAGVDYTVIAVLTE